MSPASAPPQLILASASPRREQLLREHGYSFLIDPAEIDETLHPADLSPSHLANFLARAKAQAVARRHPAAVVLAADTIVALGETILGKPSDVDHARRMLQQLSGTTHHVITAVAIARGDLKLMESIVATSAVQMRALSDPEIEGYVASDGWRGKAGGYGIQDPDPFVTRMTGSLSNIVGLPMEQTRDLLAQAGIVPRERSGA